VCANMANCFHYTHSPGDVKEARRDYRKSSWGDRVEPHPWKKQDPILWCTSVLLRFTSPLSTGGEGRRSSEAGAGGEVGTRDAALETFSDALLGLRLQDAGLLGTLT